MKKICLSVIILLVAIISKAQVPQAFSYQAVIRNSSNALVANQTVSERISLLKDSTTGTVVYSESQSVKTNANGLVSLQIGKGSVLTGNFSTINWATGNYFIKIETDPNGGSNYSLSNTTQLLSVPYALNAGNGVKKGNSIGNMLYWNGSNWDTIKVGKRGQFLQLNSNNMPQWAGLTYPTIATLPATSISYKDAVLKGVIVDGGGIGIDSVNTSFLISTTSNAPISSCKQINSFQRNADTFYIDLLGSGDSLLANTIYYVRASGYNNAYNSASGGNSIGNEISFTTSNITKLTIGQQYVGGIIFYIDSTGQHGLVCANTDQSTGAAWDASTYTTPTNATGTAIGTGSANTTKIISVLGSNGVAASLCRNYRGGGYTDWFLPSKDELNELYKNRAVVGGLATNYYWSSSEYVNLNYTYAWLQYFNFGSQDYNIKYYTNYVRAVRAF